MIIRYDILKHGESLRTLYKATEGSGAYDLACAAEDDETLEPGAFFKFPTGIRLQIPIGFFGLVCPRSGLAATHGITILNAPGVVDSDYRGEVGVVLINHGQVPVTIRRGDRIAQIMFLKTNAVEFERTIEGWEATTRVGGYGSTGN